MNIGKINIFDIYQQANISEGGVYTYNIQHVIPLEYDVKKSDILVKQISEDFFQYFSDEELIYIALGNMWTRIDDFIEHSKIIL